MPGRPHRVGPGRDAGTARQAVCLPEYSRVPLEGKTRQPPRGAVPAEQRLEGGTQGDAVAGQTPHVQVAAGR